MRGLLRVGGRSNLGWARFPCHFGARQSDPFVKHFPSRVARALLFSLATPVVALAQQAPGAEALPVRVEVLGPSSCPSADQFVRELDQHLSVRSARADEPAHALVVQINRDNGEFSGHLKSPSTSGVQGRQVSAASCSEVVAALALSASLSLEGKPPPEESRKELDQDDAARDSPQQSSDDASDPASSSSASAESEAGNPRTVGPGDGTPNDTPAFRHWWLGLGARSWSVTLPLLAGPELSLGFRTSNRDWEGRVRLGTLFELQEGSPNLAIVAPYAGVELCWMPLHAGPHFDLGLCATTDWSVMRGQGVQLRQAAAVWLPYGASGAAVRLRWQWAERWFVEADGGGQGIWLAPEWTASGPERVLEQADRGAVSAGLGLGWLF